MTTRMESREEGHVTLSPPKRDEALARPEAFVPHAGRRYADERNRDPGPGPRRNVSMRSPYIRSPVALG